METNKEKTLTDFLGINPNVVDDEKKKVVKTDRSIIERVDRIFVTESGKQLLRERY